MSTILAAQYYSYATTKQSAFTSTDIISFNTTKSTAIIQTIHSSKLPAFLTT